MFKGENCRKNKDLSDSMDRAFAAVNLPWIYRKAVGFLNYLRVGSLPFSTKPKVVTQVLERPSNLENNYSSKANEIVINFTNCPC